MCEKRKPEAIPGGVLWHKDEKADIWGVGPFGKKFKEWSFRIDYKGTLLLKGVPWWAWLIITGVSSTVASVLTVLAILEMI